MNAKRWLVQAERNRRAAIATGRRAFARERFSAILWANGFDGTLACIAGRAASHLGRIVDNEAATLNATHATHILNPSNFPRHAKNCCRKRGRNMTPPRLSTSPTR